MRGIRSQSRNITSSEEEKLFRRMWLLEALEECQPDRLRYLLISTRATITEGDKELLDFLSALWPWPEE